MPYCRLFAILAAAALWGGPALAQPSVRPAPPSGRQIEAADGDTIVIDGHARVSVVRRHEADVRVVAMPESHAMLVIADWQAVEPSFDRGIERVWRFTDVSGQWPLDARWQGRVTLYEPDAPHGSAGPMLVLETPAGRVEFHGGRAFDPTPGTAVVMTFNGMSGSGQIAASFDEAERRAMSGDFTPSFAMSSMGTGGLGFSSEVAIAAPPGRTPGQPTTPARVPSNLRGPIVVKRVEPQWPAEAQTAGVHGMVVVQIAVAPDGSVRDARVLRSVPMLDEAALAAARQWRFTPAGPEGRADPLMFTTVFRFPSR